MRVLRKGTFFSNLFPRTLPCQSLFHATLCLLKTSRIRSIKYLERVAIPAVSVKILRMIAFLRHLFGWILSTFGSRKNLALENLALRQ